MVIGHVRKSNKGEIKMKKCFKKMIIMFVMILGIMGAYNINAFADDSFEIGNNNLNNTTENSAKVENQLLKPEIGWKRYDDTNSKIKYIGTGWTLPYTEDSLNYNGTCGAIEEGISSVVINDSSVIIKFYGTKFRLISAYVSSHTKDLRIDIDGVEQTRNLYREEVIHQALIYQNTDLDLGIHTVKIYSGNGIRFAIDAIDIDDDGYLLDSDEISLSLEKTLNLKEGKSKELTATTTSSSVNLVWSSSDNTIATVDQAGKVTGLKEGTCIVTVQIKGTDVKATCEVTVTKEDIVEPEEPSGDGNLCIEMVDGNIKQAQNLNTSDFIKWYQNRDLDKTEKPFYKITNAKGNVEYLIHDKIVAFEIR